MLVFNLFLVALLIIATAFFVAAEFAIVRLRSSRVDQMVIEGKKNAQAVQRVTSNLDGYLSACQLGITITALGLGWLGEPTVERILEPVFEHYGLPAGISAVLSFVIAFATITFLHVVLGELAPKTVAIQKAEFVSLLTAKPLIFFYKVMYPFIWSLNGSANWFVRLFGIKPAKEHEEAHSEEELRIILTESYKSGKINQSEYSYVNRIFTFDERLAREIMVPRTDMVCIDLHDDRKQVIKMMKTEQYTRFPVMDGDKDQIKGFINTKQFFMQISEDPDLDLSTFIQPVLTISEAIPIKNLLRKMQQQHVHMAILVDEYGGTSGLITIEDILEEIVGEIRDEFDKEEPLEIEMIGEDHIMVDGKVSLDTISNMLHVELENENFDTIGGWLYAVNPTLKKNVAWQYGTLHFTIREKDRHRIRKVEISKVKEPSKNDGKEEE
ncbi:hemolysin family protein [Brevibacillus humidisoli]|uniref:hemolysin family protein n=1 Tax=Brevibacillus humidisoli TaxID=2895522 RepID=UPI001E44992D|nr:hemolysin family protein [Brevibacillus humidisoli]UFJ41467.1 hemolysin family protein [Brevibacillus humidisoli]